MAIGIGVLVRRSIWVGAVEGTALGNVLMYPGPGQPPVDLKSMRPDEILEEIRRMVAALRDGSAIASVGAGVPGIVRNGVIEDSPNLGQLKGLHIAAQLADVLKADGVSAPVKVVNDADALAAGIAATHPNAALPVRVWYLGDGIGFGHYPPGDGIWEAGHSVVSLDPKEHFCGCGGIGHLEGICGNRAMRLRFLDMEPEEIFAGALHGDTRAADFVKLWHRALAAATATSIHIEGAGCFYLAGKNTDFVDIKMLDRYVHEMVKMSPIEGSRFEIVPTSHDLALIGAAAAQ
jgi:predicted NBD/HSP70 family sugar kinase